MLCEYGYAIHWEHVVFACTLATLSLHQHMGATACKQGVVVLSLAPHHNDHRPCMAYTLLTPSSSCAPQHDKSWRVRYNVANQLVQLCEALGQEVTRCVCSQ